MEEIAPQNNLAPARSSAGWQTFAFVLIVLALLALGLSWMYGWFPFSSKNELQGLEAEQAIKDTTSGDQSALGLEEKAEAIELTEAGENLAPGLESEEALIDQTSAR